MTTAPKIIVLDDDPTGSQTVHSCLLLLQWEVNTLVQGLQDASPIVFILTNTRALPPAEAAAVTRTVCQNLRQAIAQCDLTNFVVVSRSDSTLRGHYPTETTVIAQELGPFAAHFLVPAFLEGGRITRDSTHYLVVDPITEAPLNLVTGDLSQDHRLIPVHTTEFAQDRVFGYHHSYLPDYVAEKTKGQIAADAVERFLLPELRAGCQARLQTLQGNVCAVVDAESQTDLNQFAADVVAIAATGQRFLFRSAASLLTALANLPPQPVAPTAMQGYVPATATLPGVIIVGSHVQKTSRQLHQLLTDPSVTGLEVEVATLRDHPAAQTDLAHSLQQQATALLEAGQTPVIYTSRQELTFPDVATRLAFGATVSALLMQIVATLPPTISFLISKGGITSNDTLSQGLSLTTVRLLGQILAGVSVVQTAPDHPRFPNLPVVLFPGNVGDDQGLLTAYQRLRKS